MAEYLNGNCKGQRTEFCGMTCQEKKSLNEQSICRRTSGKSEDKSEDLRSRQVQSNKMAEYPNGNCKSEDLRGRQVQ